MVDWRKDACKSMWFLSDLERQQRGTKLTPEQRAQVEATLKEHVARYIRMATQKVGGGKYGKSNDLDTIGNLEITTQTIVIAAVDLCLDGAFGPMPDKIEGDYNV